MKFKNYIEEEGRSRLEDRGWTTRDKGHRHRFFVNRMTGDGATSKDKGHIHKIKKMVVQESNDHIHNLGNVDNK